MADVSVTLPSSNLSPLQSSLYLDETPSLDNAQMKNWQGCLAYMNHLSYHIFLTLLIER